MRGLVICSILCLVGALHAAPVADGEDNKIVIPKRFFDKSLVKYKAKHDIVDILVPMNGINFDSSSSSESDSNSDSDENAISDVAVFLVEADVKDGERVDRGLYLYKNDKTKLILPNGRAAASSTSDNKLLYFGASDGLYIYNAKSNSADKYGPITDGIKGIATDESGKIIYILTDDHKLYNVTNNGEKKELLEDVENAQGFVLDNSNNIYFYNSDKEVFIKNSDGVSKIQELPVEPESLRLLRPPFIFEDGVPLILNNALYVAYANGSSEALGLEFSPDATPTAYGPDVVLVQYYAYNKRLYEYNLYTLINEDIFEDIKDKTEVIRSTAEKSKNTLGSKRS